MNLKLANRITTACFSRKIATKVQLITHNNIIVANPLEGSFTYLPLPTVVAIVVTKLMFLVVSVRSSSYFIQLGHLFNAKLDSDRRRG